MLKWLLIGGVAYYFLTRKKEDPSVLLEKLNKLVNELEKSGPSKDLKAKLDPIIKEIEEKKKDFSSAMMAKFDESFLHLGRAAQSHGIDLGIKTESIKRRLEKFYSQKQTLVR